MVRVIAGKDKGKEGKVLQVFPGADKIVVDGVRASVRHIKQRQSSVAQKVPFFAPIHVSNVSLLTKDGTTGRVAKKRVDGKVVRVLRKKGEVKELA